ncbi:CAP domain-containing protein [Corynebacterium axilliensis]|uniref:CAP domain-containing protein n=1 Tax=Corynebacterium sp. YSMAA5_1_F9 TaxID=3383591 RepID=UPI0038D09723
MPVNVKFLNDLPQILGVVLALLSLLGTILGITSGHDGGISSSSGPSATPDSVVASLNDYRADHNLPAVEHRTDMDAVAQAWAERIAREERLYHNPNYTAQSPDGVYIASENILVTQPGASADRIIQDWHESPGHRRNMQDPRWTVVGIGIAQDRSGRTWAVQNFGVTSLASFF